MTLVKLGDIMASEVQTVNPLLFPDETFELYSIPSFDQGAPTIVKGSQIGSSKKLLQEGDVVISRIVPKIKRVWVIPKGILRQIGSSEWIVFRGKNFKPHFIKHYLESELFHSKFLNTVSGVGGSLVRARPRLIKEIKFQMPTMLEQERIAKILDLAEELNQKPTRSFSLLEELKESLFIKIFGDPVKNEKNWKTERLIQLTSKIGSGATPRGGEKSYKEKGIPLIRSKNVYDGKFKENGIAFIDENQAKALDNAKVKTKDILLNITGASVARVCTVPAKYDGARVNQHVSIIRPNSQLNYLFLEQQLLSQNFKKTLLIGASNGATREAITKGDIEDTKIILPPIELQNDFAKAISKIVEINVANIESSMKISELFNSIQAKAFSKHFLDTIQ